MPYTFKGEKSCAQANGDEGSYYTKKKGKPGKCYKSEDAYLSSKQAYHSQNSNDEPSGKVIEEIKGLVRLILLEQLGISGISKITLEDPPAAGSIEELDDLAKVIYQYENRLVPNSLQERCDNDMEGLMKDYLSNRGISVELEEIKNIRKSVKPIISTLKNYYSRSRPDVIAARLGIDWHDDFLESSDSPSYPSGHTIQAYVCAGTLSKKYPEYSKGLFLIAELISQSRIDRGVHFPSDVDYGRSIAKELLDQGFGGQ